MAADSISTLNENDFDSPGFEFLRSYQNTVNLYYKLVALNYESDFCSLYKCPLINKYYFSVPNKNGNDQQFTFLCLCAWLIKHKCQMNLQLEPEEYESPDLTIQTILEALRLLQANGNEPLSRVSFNNWLRFPISRLKNSYGPEIVWTLNILCDHALKLNQHNQQSSASRGGSLNSKGSRRSSLVRVIYRDQTGSSDNNSKHQGPESITIGQPLVGGGLTTRPLGTYKIDDDALVLGGDSWEARSFDDSLSLIDGAAQSNHRITKPLSGKEADEWLANACSPSTVSFLESVELMSSDDKKKEFQRSTTNWNPDEFFKPLESSRNSIDKFLDEHAQPLTAISERIKRQLQVIEAREQYLRTNASREIKEFLEIWRSYSERKTTNESLASQLANSMERFEWFNEQLREARSLIEKRARDLAEGRHLRELELKIEGLNEEKRDFDERIGILMGIYCCRQSELLYHDS